MRRTLLAWCVVMSLSVAASAQPTNGDRSMEFRPGVGEAQERVPGGRLVVIAYTVVLLALGGYVGFVARRAARVETDLRRLEDDVARRADDGPAGA